MDGASAATALPEQPLLRPSTRSFGRLRRISVLIERTVGRRGPSMLVREAAARRLEERRTDWGYSRPVVALDVLWNLSFVVASVVLLSSTLRERPNVPARLWIAGYALQCLVHVVLVWVEYGRRGRSVGVGERTRTNSDAGTTEEEEVEEEGSEAHSFIKRCESLNTMASFVWWIVGLYWVLTGADAFLQHAPRLYWLMVVFLACDLFFALFSMALACVIGIALCCCLPCIIAILYAFAGQEGASDADISILPCFSYKDHDIDGEKLAEDGGIMVPHVNDRDDTITERFLLREDAECCVCLTSYEDGAELRSLPCNHHFHSSCIVKWLRIHATCPLCKYNILKGNEHV